MNGRVLSLTFSFFSAFLYAQNLVPNPSFEELIRCPHSFSTDKKDFLIPGWVSPTKGTPDQFHACSWGEADVPYNWAGSSNAKSGKGYVGIYVWMQGGNNYREYIQCELAESMQPGVRYRVEFFYKLTSNSVYSVNRIGLLLTLERITFTHDQVIDIAPTLSIEKDSALVKATGSWEHAAMEYVATGGELYLTLGNFFENARTQYTRLSHRIGKNSMLANSAYFYIDDVNVIPIDSFPVPVVKSVQQFQSEKIELNKDYILKNIQFEFDSYTLLNSSFKELDQVIGILSDNPAFHVRLAGHTDFVGSDDYNVTLSRNRARSVADYFISKGIKPERISSFGFGKSRPLVNEKTDEARSINRRVEIRFTEITPDRKF